MLTFVEHPAATCPECCEPLFYGTKEESTGWKVYYECDCGWECKAGWVSRSGVAHRDEVVQFAEEMGERWTRP